MGVCVSSDGGGGDLGGDGCGVVSFEVAADALRVCFDRDTLGATLVRFDRRFPGPDDSQDGFLSGSTGSDDNFSGNSVFSVVLLHSVAIGVASTPPENDAGENRCKRK